MLPCHYMGDWFVDCVVLCSCVTTASSPRARHYNPIQSARTARAKQIGWPLSEFKILNLTYKPEIRCAQPSVLIVSGAKLFSKVFFLPPF